MHHPTRLAVVGHRGDLGTCLPAAPMTDTELHWVERPVDPDPGALRSAVDQLEPDIVLVIEPEHEDGGLFAGSGRACAAWLVAAREPGAEPEPALAGFDRVLAACPGAAARAPSAYVWRLQPLPVSDHCFASVAPNVATARVFFDGPTSERRDVLLQPTKHHFDLLHLAGGATPERLSDLHGRSDVALDLREEPGVAPRDRIGTGLAAGLLVIAERPVLRPGLIDGAHLLTFSELWQLHDLLFALRRHPDAMRSVRVRGRQAAERLRASVAFPALARDLLADVTRFGRSPSVSA